LLVIPVKLGAENVVDVDLTPLKGSEDDINEERERETHTERRRPKIDPKYKIDP